MRKAETCSKCRSRPISLNHTTDDINTGEKSRAINTIRGRRSESCDRSGACARNSAIASSGVIGDWRRLWKAA